MSNTGYHREGVSGGRKKQMFTHHSFHRVPTGFLVVKLLVIGTYWGTVTLSKAPVDLK